jgi:hypothetical protein
LFLLHVGRRRCSRIEPQKKVKILIELNARAKPSEQLKRFPLTLENLDHLALAVLTQKWSDMAATVGFIGDDGRQPSGLAYAAAIQQQNYSRAMRSGGCTIATLREPLRKT